jgi:tellurite methyltransferase
MGGAADFTDWDERHRAAADQATPEPATFVTELLSLLPGGTALDLACGTGRHSLLLAGRGQRVVAVDGSAVALDVLEARALAMQRSVRRLRSFRDVSSAHSGIDLIQADLEQVTLPERAFALIVCVHYLQRSLFPQIQLALVPGGMLLFETFTRAQLEFDGGPKNPEYLLECGELRMAFPGLRLLFYRELRAGKGIASLIAQKPQRSPGLDD